MTKLLLSAVSLAMLGGCVTPQKAPQPQQTIAPEHQRAIEMGEFKSLITAYEIPHGRMQDDSADITFEALSGVAAMANCPAISNSFGLPKYRASAFVDSADMTVKIRVNRPGCVVSKMLVQSYLSDSIHRTKQAKSAQFDKEKNARESNPQGPYLMGCLDYQRFVKGGNNQPDVALAKQQYPQVNPIYAQRLYLTGWEDARQYGVRTVSCERLAQVNIRR